MYKKELVDIVADKSGVSKKDTEQVINATINAIAEALKNGDSVQFTGFGAFQVSERPAREGMNPKTGKKVQLAATKIPKFKAGKALKDVVNG